ncbi:MAG: sugar isomerase [Spirochaetales bacterium]|nr:MAG: sugar isomerase [Spirochaetales bacterium]
MNLGEERYSKYALVREMMETIEVVRTFAPERTASVAKKIAAAGSLFLTGEGSSRIFPAKNAIRKALRWGTDLRLATDGSRQSSEYDLSRFAVFLASNSGRTKEVVTLARKIKDEGNSNRFGLSANQGTALEAECVETFVLGCGWEQAVAATKSVVEQALFYESVLRHVAGKPPIQCAELADAIAAALTLPISSDIVAAAAGASTIYFAGYNDGVAEELTLKTNEMTRRKSDFLEGTYAVHGIEEVMTSKDVVFLVDPIVEEVGKFREVLEQGVGLKVVAISAKDTPFATVKVPDLGDLNPFVLLCAGWNLLVEIGLRLGINLDKAERARKVGNEIPG